MNEARNTFNAIAGRQQVVTSMWCKFGLHRWQKWSDIRNENKPGYSTIYHRIQDRYCDSCNKYQCKEIDDGP